MKTKHILYLYFSMLLGYLTTEFFSFNFWFVYIASSAAYLFVLCLCDAVLKLSGFPLLSTELRIHSEKRELGGDIARTIAVFFVPVIHFFGLTFYYSTEFTPAMILPTVLRWLSVCAVPLFMILSGYFKCNSKINKKHFFSIVPLLFTHIFISAVRIYVDFKFHNIKVDTQYILNKMLYFEYGWYIRLYIGMLLLMPFFNAAYKGLCDKQKKEIFILILVGLNCLGPLTFDAIPSSWLILYVFGYYIIGCYLYEYKVKINPFIGIAAIIFILCFISVSTYIRCKGNTFDWDFAAYHQNSGYSSPAVVFVSVLIMVLCLNINISSKPVRLIFQSISTVSLEMYLFSQMFDGFIYKDIISGNVPFLDTFKNIIPLVGSCIILSFIASRVKKLIFMPAKLIFKINKKRQKANETEITV